MMDEKQSGRMQSVRPLRVMKHEWRFSHGPEH